MAVLEPLRSKFPHWTIRQAPDPDCHACKGTGEISKTLRPGRLFEAPCMCVVTKLPHGPETRQLMKDIGAAAGRILKRDFGHWRGEAAADA